MGYYAGVSAFGHRDKGDSGIIEVVDSPGSTTRIGQATSTGARGVEGKVLYNLGHLDDRQGHWLLEDGEFKRVDGLS